MDGNCQADLVGAAGDDSSGFFVKRFYEDPDGVPPYLNEDAQAGKIGGFQLTLADAPMSPPIQSAPKRKCKKHKHRAASAKKKHCKKKRR